MTTIFSNFRGDSLEVFKDDFSIFGNDFESCLSQETTGAKLGEISLHGMRGSSARAYHLGQRTRGGQGQNRGHPKPPSSRYRTRFEELFRAC